MKRFRARHIGQKVFATVTREFSTDGFMRLGKVVLAVAKRREQTGPQTTRRACKRADIYLLQDLLFTESLRRNKAISIDTWLALAEITTIARHLLRTLSTTFWMSLHSFTTRRRSHWMTYTLARARWALAEVAAWSKAMKRGCQ